MRTGIISVFMFLGLLFNIAVNAATPTMEGLFRNGDNKEIKGNFGILKFYINEFVDEKKLQTITVANENGELSKSLETQKAVPRFFKLIFSVEEDRPVQMLQVEYKSAEMNSNDLLKANFFPNIINTTNYDVFVERPLLYSLILMFVLNDSKAISYQLRKLDPSFLPNSLAMNNDKKKLMLKYKEYLAAIKDDEEVKKVLISPLEVDVEEEKLKIAELQKQNMYNKSDKITLERIGKEFVWSMKLDNISALFANSNHRLRSMKITKDDSSIDVNCGNYVLLDGIHSFPEVINIKDLQGASFNVSMTYLRYFTNSGDSLKKRYKEYLKKIGELKRVIAEKPANTAETLLY